MNSLDGGDLAIAIAMVYLFVLILIRMLEGDKRKRVRGELHSADIAKCIRRRQRGRS
jgi:hypothetical protein